MRCNAFLSHPVAVSFPKKVVPINISNLTPIPLFILVPVTLQLAYDPGKWRNLFNLLFTITEKLQDVRLKRRKQDSIKDIFSTNFQCS